MENLPPLLTLEQLRETGPLGQELMAAARRHVGAAGLEQAACLERLLRVCRDQAAVSTALRSLAWALGQMQDGEQAARAELLTALNAQLGLASRSEAVLAEALRDVTSTPAVFLSAAALQEIEQDAKGQLNTLRSLFNQAKRYGRTPEQQQEFERLGLGMQEALDRAEQDEVVGRAETLGVIIAEATAQLVKLPLKATPAVVETLERVAAELRTRAARPNPPGREG
ncbi:hypothetical protein [Deinococcus aestuarii]|uniref:hypothetical protein n=1 Tax=Deinococcus aestuarii TaxID=2774531 RepID=UPI001C0C76F9|nr:hypothetical protein [Deinococcus aestuarii]